LHPISNKRFPSDRKNGFAKVVDLMKNDQVPDSGRGLSVGVCFAVEPTSSATKIQSNEFDEMLRQAWLILTSRERTAAKPLPNID
jgi:hypothetical protein